MEEQKYLVAVYHYESDGSPCGMKLPLVITKDRELAVRIASAADDREILYMMPNGKPGRCMSWLAPEVAQ